MIVNNNFVFQKSQHQIYTIYFKLPQNANPNILFISNTHLFIFIFSLFLKYKSKHCDDFHTYLFLNTIEKQNNFCKLMKITVMPDFQLKSNLFYYQFIMGPVACLLFKLCQYAGEGITRYMR